MERIEIQSGDQTDEWPEAVKRAFIELTMLAREHNFRVVGALGLNVERERISVFFSPHTSQNPNLADMCDDLSEMFQKMAKRLRQ